jgi:hypothetical protein
VQRAGVVSSGPTISFQAPDAHRLTAVGATRSGKSELLRYLFTAGTSAGARGVLIDPKGEWAIEGVPRVDLSRGVEQTGLRAVQQARDEVRRGVDWQARLVHVRPRWQARAQLVALYGELARLPGDVVVWTDEAYGVSDGNWAPPGLLELQTAGASRGHAHLAGAQRPRNVKRELFTEADHVFMFGRLDSEDVKVARQGAPFLGVRESLRLLADLPEWGYLWIDRRAGVVRVADPLPDAFRLEGPVRKR